MLIYLWSSKDFWVIVDRCREDSYEVSFPQRVAPTLWAEIRILLHFSEDSGVRTQPQGLKNSAFWKKQARAPIRWHSALRSLLSCLLELMTNNLAWEETNFFISSHPLKTKRESMRLWLLRGNNLVALPQHLCDLQAEGRHTVYGQKKKEWSPGKNWSARDTSIIIKWNYAHLNAHYQRVASVVYRPVWPLKPSLAT